jgi:hypothetical protein
MKLQNSLPFMEKTDRCINNNQAINVHRRPHFATVKKENPALAKTEQHA